MLWKIFVRYPHGKKDWASECYSLGIVALGWSKIGDISKVEYRIEVEELLSKKIDYRSEPKRKLINNSSSLYSFAKEVQVGDLIIMPDSHGKCFYIGEVESNYYFQSNKRKEDSCPFLHRRKVKWIKGFSKSEVTVLLGTYFGAPGSVSRVSADENKFRRFIKAKRRKVNVRVPANSGKPDAIWGRTAELRALELLGDKAEDVANLCLGWDISLGDRKYEVKGRHSKKGIIRLTQREYNMAKKYKKNYILLVFTAPTEKELKKSYPEEIPDPADTRLWDEKTIKEYRLFEE
jgi:hypothetical protein